MSLMCHEEVKDDKPFHKSGQNVSKIAFILSKYTTISQIFKTNLWIFAFGLNDKEEFYNS